MASVRGSTAPPRRALDAGVDCLENRLPLGARSGRNRPAASVLPRLGSCAAGTTAGPGHWSADRCGGRQWAVVPGVSRVRSRQGTAPDRWARHSRWCGLLSSRRGGACSTAAAGDDSGRRDRQRLHSGAAKPGGGCRRGAACAAAALLRPGWPEVAVCGPYQSRRLASPRRQEVPVGIGRRLVSRRWGHCPVRSCRWRGTVTPGEKTRPVTGR